jgi:hypothetical protein
MNTHKTLDIGLLRAEKPAPNARDILGLLTFSTIVIVLVALSTIADMNVLFEYFPRWGVVVPCVLLLVIGVRGRMVKAKIGVLTLFILWMLVLPHIRWNHLKAFYIDCHSISRGESRESTYLTMADYSTSSMEFETAEQVIFTPSNAFFDADWCIVEFQGDNVYKAYPSPD